MIKVQRTADFDRWLAGLRDRIAVRKITTRIDAIRGGHLGDWRSVGDEVSELRIHYGPGYRLYFTRRGERLVLLLAGGDKDSQPRDILRAKALAADTD